MNFSAKLRFYFHICKSSWGKVTEKVVDSHALLNFRMWFKNGLKAQNAKVTNNPVSATNILNLSKLADNGNRLSSLPFHPHLMTSTATSIYRGCLVAGDFSQFL